MSKPKIIKEKLDPKKKEEIKEKKLTLDEVKEKRAEEVRKAFKLIYPHLKDHEVLYQLSAFKVKSPEGRRFVLHYYTDVEEKMDITGLLEMLIEIFFMEESNAAAQIALANLNNSILQQLDKQKEAKQKANEEVNEEEVKEAVN